MPSLKEVKGRIASVNSTRKITSAMKMVASSQVRPVKRVALVVFTSNSSLCGGFNANTIKLMLNAVDTYSKEIGSENVEIYPIGRKVYEKAKKMGLNIQGEFSALADKPNVNKCIEIAMELGQKFYDGDIDKVELIYHHFKSAGSLNADHERDLTSVIATKESQEYLKKRGERQQEKEKENVKPLNDNFIVEPDMSTVLTQLLPKYAHLLLYTALLDNNASEHAARMVAMQTATDNADELLRELLDIAGGSSQ